MTTTDQQPTPVPVLGRLPGAGAVTITQYSRRAIVAIWAAAALPMGAAAWIVAPAIADGGGGIPLARALLVCLTAGPHRSHVWFITPPPAVRWRAAGRGAGGPSASA